MPMKLSESILDILRHSGKAMTVEEIAKGIAGRLEEDIRATLNELAKTQQVLRHVGGRDHPWRYQVKTKPNRRI